MDALVPSHTVGAGQRGFGYPKKKMRWFETVNGLAGQTPIG